MPFKRHRPHLNKEAYFPYFQNLLLLYINIFLQALIYSIFASHLKFYKAIGCLKFVNEFLVCPCESFELKVRFL